MYLPFLSPTASFLDLNEDVMQHREVNTDYRFAKNFSVRVEEPSS